MLLALLAVFGFAAWALAWKCRQDRRARPYALGIIALLLGGPTVAIFLLMNGLDGIALVILLLALGFIGVFWSEMMSPPK